MRAFLLLCGALTLAAMPVAAQTSDPAQPSCKIAIAVKRCVTFVHGLHDEVSTIQKGIVARMIALSPEGMNRWA